MGVDTKIYFTNRVSAAELISAIETEFNTTVDISRMRHDDIPLGGGLERNCGYLSFNDMNFHFYQYNYIYGGERDGTNPDTISAYADPERYEALKRIAPYFGGHVIQFDSSDEYTFIPKTKGIEQTKEQKLREIVYSSIGFQQCDNAIKMIQDNLEFIKSL